MPSRVIISSVNRNTPANAAAPRLQRRGLQMPFDVALDALRVRHMWTVSDATEIAATIASTPSHRA